MTTRRSPEQRGSTNKHIVIGATDRSDRGPDSCLGEAIGEPDRGDVLIYGSNVFCWIAARAPQFIATRLVHAMPVTYRWISNGMW